MSIHGQMFFVRDVRSVYKGTNLRKAVNRISVENLGVELFN